MSVRLLLGVALVVNVLVIVVCTGQGTRAAATSVETASAKSSSSYASSSSSAKSVIVSKPKKCRRVRKCPKNEEFSFCPQSIKRAQYCSEKAEPYSSPSDKRCKAGCVCKENYLRADDGTCIPAEQCPLTCDTNEVLDNCPTDCYSDYCPTEEDTEVEPCVVPDVCPPPVCKCAFNYLRASNGSCIPTRDCPAFDCSSRPNEEYNPCPPLCPTDDCSQASPTGECPPLIGRIGIVLPCNPKCRCIKDYWRLNGTCVPYGQCPGVCPDNERYSTCIQGECRALNCTQRDQSVPCVRLDPKFCEKGCVCQEGYLRNQDGVCVLEEKCEPPVCPTNEEWSTCAQATCRAQNCTQRGKPIACPMIMDGYCEEACVCKENYLRDVNGDCIPEEQCPCGDNEVLDECPKTCTSDYCPQSADEEQVCTQTDTCVPSCKCRFNYKRAENGTCIPTRNCPGVCPVNERYSTCIQGECRALNCTQRDQSVPCVRLDPTFCEKGCVCQEGYLRNQDGVCVLEEKCEPGKCPLYEQWSDCANAVCGAQFCSQKGLPVSCPAVSECVPGCLCQNNYLRNESGICIPEEDCKAPSCPANEEFVQCIQGVCRAKECFQRGEDVPCPDIPQEQCDSGCICKENFLRAENGSCVPEDQCESGKCPLYEQWSDCANAVCRAEFCSQKGLAVPCPAVSECVPGCLCQNNYLRNDSGICIPEEDCKACGDTEILDECPMTCNTDYCPQSADEEQVCTQADPCVPACKCRFNFKRSENGTCIPTRNCPPFDCSAKPNEEYVACPPLCPTDECGKPRLEGRCPFRIGILLKCQPKCQCKDGYGRDNGTCVPFEECPGICPDNERYSTCIQSECRALNCTQRDQSVPCVRLDPKFCNKGCVCQEGYLRNQDGICVLEEKCEPPVCPTNEEWSTCAQATCRAQNCKQRGKPIACPMIMGGYCEEACVCKENYLRDVNGDCIPEEQCPCGDNEVLDECPKTCTSDYCPQSADEEQVCTQTDTCVPSCKCRFNYKRAENGTCIPTRNCPAFDCSSRPNEEYNPCPPLCPTDDCSQASPTGECPPLIGRIGIVLPCNPKCRCIKDYWRLNGTCVPYGQCPGVCPDNERYSTCIQGECRALNCTQRDQSVPCVRLDPKFCEKGCVCQEGYLRNQDGVCVLEEKCEPGKCPLYEQWSDCANAVCGAEFCSQKGLPVPCPAVSECVPGCLCQNNYLRNDSGICIPEEDCKAPSCPANEEFVQCIQGVCRAKECFQRGEDVPCPDIPQEQCDSGCICKENFLRAENGSCVPEDQCESGKCPLYEQWSDCANAVCRAEFCSQKGLAVPCPAVSECVPGCLCQNNYLRNDSGICIPEEDCKACGDTEILDECPMTCNTDYCPQSADEEQVCTQADPCVPACKCRFNFKRSENGTCIPTTNCPPFDCSAKPNEEFVACPPLCPTDECGKPRLEGRCPFRIGILLKCQPKCQCKDGYGRDNGTCVPFEECPGICPDNERYSSCIQSECRALNCTQRDQSVPCVRLDPKFCKKGCVCQEGYLRNQNGICVLEKKCEPRVCPTNEEWSTCAQATCRAQNCTQRDKPIACPMIMDGYCEEACVCKENYLRDENGDCVPEDQCLEKPGKCPLYEQWSDCANAVCRAEFCSQKGLAVPCPAVSECVPGCLCQSNYLRNESGICIPEEDCKACGDNEVLDECPMTCNSDYCPQSADEEQVCTQADPCVPACKCRFNFKRSENGTCIPTTNCPPFDCSAKPNEEFVACPPLCPTDECGKPRLEGRCPFRIGILLKCQPKCQCKDGYGRDNGTCVPFEECPGICPDNERYSSCIQSECRALNCTQRDQSVPCVRLDPTFCKKGCVCQEGYLRNQDGVCVLEEKCEPRVCPTNEEWSTCAQATCRAQNCTQKGKPIPCPDILDGYCEEACVCKENYLRNENGDCVPEDQCLEKPGKCPLYEQWSDCANAVCRAEFCSQKGLAVPCPAVSECVPGCLCQNNYLRNESGICIPEEDCKACGDNEVLDECPMTCNTDYCPQSADEEQVCTQADPCVPACKCRLNYKRAENGTCIPSKNCPPFDCSAKANEEFVACPPLCSTDECTKPRLKGRCPFRKGIILKCKPKCQCKDGYGRVNGTCVPFEECPDLCSANEVYSSCVQRTCRPQNCSDRDVAMDTCPVCDTDSCKRGCVCQENFYRNEKGVCVSYEECGGPMCPNANEEYTPNFRECPPNTCGALVDRKKCDENQKVGPGCVCKSGFLRLTPTSPCIPICDCPEMKYSADC